MRDEDITGRDALMAPYEAKLALCFDYSADWALGIQPGQPKLKYMGEMVPWYSSISASHAGVDIVAATQDLSRYKVVCAPAMYVVSATQADRIRAYVQGGGTFIAGFRLGVNNVLDQDPPLVNSRIVGTGLPNAYPTYDLLGRQMFMGVTANF